VEISERFFHSFTETQRKTRRRKSENKAKRRREKITLRRKSLQGKREESGWHGDEEKNRSEDRPLQKQED